MIAPTRILTARPLAAAVLLASWGLFVRQNVEAEKLEPEAMHQAQEEDKHVET